MIFKFQSLAQLFQMFCTLMPLRNSVSSLTIGQNNPSALSAHRPLTMIPPKPAYSPDDPVLTKEAPFRNLRVIFHSSKPQCCLRVFALFFSQCSQLPSHIDSHSENSLTTFSIFTPNSLIWLLIFI